VSVGVGESVGGISVRVAVGASVLVGTSVLVGVFQKVVHAGI
jgi:hypothetical protein